MSNIGIYKEINKDYIGAVKYYEKEIAEGSHLVYLDTFINLSFLYWSFAFERFEFTLPNNISDKWSSKGGNRYKEVLKLGLNQYPNSFELHFWEKYFANIIFGEKFSYSDCLLLVEEYKNDKTIAPYFFLYLFDNEKYRYVRDVLLKECIDKPTAKNLYIKSMID